MRYILPPSLHEALALRAHGAWRVLAGGTDFYPAVIDSALAEDVLDISAVAALKAIDRGDRVWRIGALATWTDILRTELPPAFVALKQAAREIGSVQIQNVATVAGNLCNASPAADGVPPLLVLDARVELQSISERREMPLSSFILGNRHTSLRHDEIVTAILIPADNDHARTHFLKLGARRYLVISIAMVAVLIDLGSDGLIRTARLAVGSCSVAARRLRTLERQLCGLPLSADIADVIQADAMTELAPIDDIRSSASYRSMAAAELVRRAVLACIGSTM